MAIHHDGVVIALQRDDPDDGDEGRKNRGLAIAALAVIEKNLLGYRVPSQSGNGAYIVNLDDYDEPICSCPDYEMRLAPCKHVYAAIYSQQRQTPAPAIGGLGGTKAVGVTYPQNWPAYNAAKTHEGDHFPYLLRGLCDMVEQPMQGRGRPQLPISDMIFANTLKVYEGHSGRITMPKIRYAEQAGFIDHAPSYNTSFRYMDNPDITPILENLVTVSALPLSGLESHFSIDSTGFTTSQYDRWFEEKWGRMRSQARWAKAHVMSGALTHVVVCMAVTDGDVNDSPLLKPLLNDASEDFVIKQLSADKAYLSLNNLQAIYDIGAQPFIPFKTNSVLRMVKNKKDSSWNRAFHYVQLHRDDFLRYYHQRSNVETVFWMAKARFDTRIRSKNPVAQTNEVLTKFLCHNIGVLVTAFYEHGVDPTFSKGTFVPPAINAPPLQTPTIFRN